MDNMKKCHCCGVEKECKMLGHDGGRMIYVCVSCVKKELRKAMEKMKQEDENNM